MSRSVETAELVEELQRMSVEHKLILERQTDLIRRLRIQLEEVRDDESRDAGESAAIA